MGQTRRTTELAARMSPPSIAAKSVVHLSARNETPRMSTAISVTRLLGLNLSPGKLRGLQRISNANGTLTMVATDQNSSMISMLKDSFKKKGQDREPTYDEIVDAKIV